MRAAWIAARRFGEHIRLGQSAMSIDPLRVEPVRDSNRCEALSTVRMLESRPKYLVSGVCRYIPAMRSGCLKSPLKRSGPVHFFTLVPEAISFFVFRR